MSRHSTVERHAEAPNRSRWRPLANSLRLCPSARHNATYLHILLTTFLSFISIGRPLPFPLTATSFIFRRESREHKQSRSRAYTCSKNVLSEDYGQGVCSILSHRMRTLRVLFDRKVVHIVYPVLQPYAAVVSEPREASARFVETHVAGNGSRVGTQTQTEK
jgi:hypothetical protein